MSKLGELRSRLSGLRRRRQMARWGTAYAAVASAALWILAGAFVIDFLFERQMSLSVRIVALLVYVGIGVWAFRRYAAPFLGHSETDVDMALLVERQKLDPDHRDLVAAMQFESPEADRWGSRQLENAVIDYVAQYGRGLDVYEGFSREQFARRAGVFVLSAAAAAVLVALFPAHALTFFNRLALGSRHYPTRTVIERVVVNYTPVLIGEEHGTSPEDTRGAEGHPVTFTVQCSGQLPTAAGRHYADLVRTRTGQGSVLDLEPLSAEDRQQRLQQAAEKIAAARSAAGGAHSLGEDVNETWIAEVTHLVRFDAPRAAESLAAASNDPAQLAEAETELQKVLADWPAGMGETALYVGRLQKMSDRFAYQLTVGDAWTDPAGVEMIRLPLVDAQLVARPPSYAVFSDRQGEDAAEQVTSRQISVVEGSSVSLGIISSKPLNTATATIDGRQRPLTKQDSSGKVWSLEDPDSPLAEVHQQIEFEVRVVDTDGLAAEYPLGGMVRLKTDRAPQVSASAVTLFVRPVATPRINYRVSDDYGVSKVLLHARVVKPEGSSPDEPRTMVVLEPAQPLLRNREALPLSGVYQLGFSALAVEKGDKVEVELEVVDFRGPRPGRSGRSDVIVFQVTDKVGAVAAVGDADKRSASRLGAIILSELGIGEK